MIDRTKTVVKLNDGPFAGYHAAAPSDATVLSVRMRGQFVRHAEYVVGVGQYVFAYITTKPKGHVCEAF